MNEDTIELLRKLCEADAVPGFEDEVRAIFEERWSDLGTPQYDRLGGIVLERRGRADHPRVAVECHMDEVGFLVRAVSRAGLLKLVPLGGFWTQALPGQRLTVLTSRPGKPGKVLGIIGATPPHLLGKNRDRAVEVKDLLVDVGAESAEDVAKLGIRPGCPAVLASAFTPMASGRRVAAKAFDDRVGCAVCIEVVEAASNPPGVVLGVASVQEEVGLRGVQVSAQVACPDVALVLEGSPADDVAGTSPEESQGKLGGGVQIRAYDPTMIAPRGLVDLAIEVAKAEKIPYQVAVRHTGGTNAGRLHLHDRGVPTLVLGVPVRYAHSHAGIIDYEDVAAMKGLTRALVNCLDEETVRDRVLPRGWP